MLKLEAPGLQSPDQSVPMTRDTHNWGKGLCGVAECLP